MSAGVLDTVPEAEELLFPPETELDEGGGNGNGPGDIDPGGRGGGGDGDDGEEDSPAGIYRISMWATITAIGTLFAVLAAAYVARSQMPKFWQPIELPRILWLSSAVLMVSSATCEAARRALRRFRLAAYGGWLMATALLGVAFLGMQILAWRQLAAEGVFLSENPHSSFFYLFTAAHGLHLLGGVLILGVLAVRAWLPGARRQRAETRMEIADSAAIFWHFLDGVWVGLFALLLALG